MRITTSLTNAQDDSTVWSEKFDTTIDEIFDTQDEIIETIVATIAGRVEVKLWLRNCALLFLFAGSLHWWLHRQNKQGRQYRMNRNTLAADPKAFLWGDQVKDNMFWSIVSGVTVWTGFEVIS